MGYRGQFKQGVVFEKPPPFPDGAAVEVEPVDRQRDLPTWGEVLKDFMGQAKGLPADMARNHNHYIHGARRK